VRVNVWERERERDREREIGRSLEQVGDGGKKVKNDTVVKIWWFRPRSLKDRLELVEAISKMF
jgi:hypothetical protein